MDRRHKLVRRYQVTDAAVHDSQVVDDILDPDNTASEVWADSAYRSAEIEAKLKEKGLKSADPPQGVSQQAAERAGEAGQHDPFEGRARVEHVFGAQSNDMGGTLVRSIGMVRGEGADRAEEPSPTTCAAWCNWNVSPRRQRDGRQGRSPPGVEDYREIGPPGNGETRKTGASNLAAVRETTRHVRIHASRVIFRGAL